MSFFLIFTNKSCGLVLKNRKHSIFETEARSTLYSRRGAASPTLMVVALNSPSSLPSGRQFSFYRNTREGRLHPHGGCPESQGKHAKPH